MTTATPGGNVTYTIVTSNAGPSNATGATVADTFPVSQTCNWTCSGAGGGTCTASGSGNINDLVNLPSGGTATYTATCAIAASATGSMSNTATITTPSGVNDTVPGNKPATDTDTLNASADLSVTKTDGVTTATAGGSVTYTITASNAGPSNAPASTVADTFPASETCTWTCVGAGGGTCTAAGAGNINDAINLPSGGSATYTASCSISASTSGALSNTATVTAAAGVTDSVPGNNSATDTDTVTGTADLAITKTDGVTTATPGGSVTYTIVASNATGPSDVSGAIVADTFPASLTCNWTCSGAGGGTCAASGSGNINSSVNIPVGGSTTFTASCTISAAATGTLSNTATVTAPAGVTDPTPGNNSATDSDALSALANLTVTLSDGHAHARYGQMLNYLLKISNAGPSNATDIGIFESFSPSFADASAQWTCIGGDAGASCTPSGMGPLSDSNVVIPASRSLTWLISVSVLNNVPDNFPNFADNVFHVTTLQDPNAPYNVLDADLLVLFRDGFEPGLQDGTGDIAEPAIDVHLNSVTGPLGVGQSLSFIMPGTAGSRPVDTLVQARAVDGTGFRIERLNLDKAPSVRIVSIGLLGAEHAGKWTPTQNAGHVMVGLIDSAGTEAMLATASGESTLQLSEQVPEVYRVDSVGVANVIE